MLVALLFQVGYFVSLGKRLPKETRNVFGEGFGFLCFLECSKLGGVPEFLQPFCGQECILQIQLHLLLLGADGLKLILQSYDLQKRLGTARRVKATNHLRLF